MDNLSKQPLVSICCVTYNHENFIRHTIQSFLNQSTNFDFEIVIGEDCSKDNTRNIIEAFIQTHPNRIRLLPITKNLGMKKNISRTLAECKGKYIAYCEGDDYWTDNEKLQKQYDFLSSNLDYAISFASVQAHTIKGIDYQYNGGVKFNLSNDKLILTEGINTLTTMFKNIFSELPPEFMMCGTPDLFLWSLLGHHGSGYYDESILPSIYRIHPGGVHSSKTNTERVLMRFMTFYALYIYYRRIGNTTLESNFLDKSISDIMLIKVLLRDELDQLYQAVEAMGLNCVEKNNLFTLINSK